MRPPGINKQCKARHGQISTRLHGRAPAAADIGGLQEALSWLRSRPSSPSLALLPPSPPWRPDAPSQHTRRAACRGCGVAVPFRKQPSQGREDLLLSMPHRTPAHHGPGADEGRLGQIGQGDGPGRAAAKLAKSESQRPQRRRPLESRCTRAALRRARTLDLFSQLPPRPPIAGLDLSALRLARRWRRCMLLLPPALRSLPLLFLTFSINRRAGKSLCRANTTPPPAPCTLLLAAAHCPPGLRLRLSI